MTLLYVLDNLTYEYELEWEQVRDGFFEYMFDKYGVATGAAKSMYYDGYIEVDESDDEFYEFLQDHYRKDAQRQIDDWIEAKRAANMGHYYF